MAAVDLKDGGARALCDEGVAARVGRCGPQPSLSRQIRDLELEVGVKALECKPRGISLTAAGRVFLDQARLRLMQVVAAEEAARRAEKPEKSVFVVVEFRSNFTPNPRSDFRRRQRIAYKCSRS
jgi:DNA-binding transcriptional LysR family regulator